MDGAPAGSIASALRPRPSSGRPVGHRAGDALQAEWPEVDTIIGNPPFLGSQRLRMSLGNDYVAWLSKRFGVGIKDLCVYWFRKAQQALKPGQRAGLVGTNSVSQNKARGASLDYIVSTGGVITDAVSTQKWPGDAKVHVSIVNWVKQPGESPSEFELDGAPVTGITSSLRVADGSGDQVQPLTANRGRCFQGPIPVGDGFILTEADATALLRDTDADYSTVVRRYLTSDDIADSPGQAPSRWIIDFANRTLEQATAFPRALAIVRKDVKPERERNRDAGFRSKWWQFGRPRTEMRTALAPLSRYFAVGRHGKRMLIAAVDPGVIASDATNVFAFDDDYSLGILLSTAHDAWAWARSSTLETRLRYTPTSVFATFAWPDPVDDATRQAVAAAASALYARRSELCTEHDMGLTKLYNLMDEGGFTDLRALHKALDAAVVAAYGWPASVAQDRDELVRRLSELNRRIASGERSYHPFGGAATLI
ncbi:MAG: type IIL restriction-modification enzyme MmeI [Schumannella sp.]